MNVGLDKICMIYKISPDILDQKKVKHDAFTKYILFKFL